MSRVGRSVGVAAILAAACAAGAIGSAIASGSPPDSTDVGFIAITPHRLLTNASIAAKHASSPVVIAGATTVPSDATTVQLSISAHSTTAGEIAVYPAGDPQGANDHFVSYPKGGGTVTVTDAEHPGTANEVTLMNTGASAVVVTVSIVGYSTQVNSASITGAGGTTGQVLTNTGSGAAWQTMGEGYATHDGVDGVVIPAGVQTYSPVAHLTVPAGSYDVEAILVAYGAANDLVQCELRTPSGANEFAFNNGYMWQRSSTTFGQANLTLDGLLTTGGGAIALNCQTGSAGVIFRVDGFRAIQLSGASGAVGTDH